MRPEAGELPESSALSLPARIPEPVGDDVPARAPGLPGAPDLVARLRGSLWSSVALRTAGIFAGMLALAGIGAASTLAGAGVPVAIAGPGRATGTATLPGSGASAAPVAPSIGGAEARAPTSAGPPRTSGALPSGTTAGGAVSAGVTEDGKIVLNAASAEEFQKLPRVGAKRAAAIIELRTKLGRFRTPTDLLRVRGIGRKTLRSLLPLLVVDGPKTNEGTTARGG